jgi:hypothetical protein
MLLNPYRFSVGGGGGNPDAQSILASLISWWDFEETSGGTWSDAHGANPLTSNSVSAMTTASGKRGRSTECLSAGEWAENADTTKFAFGDESFTVFLWHYPVSSEPSYAYIAGKYYADSARRSYELSRQSSTGNFVVTLSVDGSATTIHQGPSKTATDTAFNLLAFGYNATTDMGFLIVDGARSEFAHAGGMFSASTARFCIGARRSSVGGTAASGLGRHDSAGVMSSAITDAEFAVLFNAGSGLNYSELAALAA